MTSTSFLQNLNGLRYYKWLYSNYYWLGYEGNEIGFQLVFCKVISLVARVQPKDVTFVSITNNIKYPEHICDPRGIPCVDIYTMVTYNITYNIKELGYSGQPQEAYDMLISRLTDKSRTPVDRNLWTYMSCAMRRYGIVYTKTIGYVCWYIQFGIPRAGQYLEIMQPSIVVLSDLPTTTPTTSPILNTDTLPSDPVSFNLLILVIVFSVVLAVLLAIAFFCHCKGRKSNTRVQPTEANVTVSRYKPLSDGVTVSTAETDVQLFGNAIVAQVVDSGDEQSHSIANNTEQQLVVRVLHCFVESAVESNDENEIV